MGVFTKQWQKPVDTEPLCPLDKRKNTCYAKSDANEKSTRPESAIMDHS